ncbi:CBS domain-containing protein [Streptomyces chiangmaiensis]
MTSDVIRAEYATAFKEVARLLVDGRISGPPVVDGDDKAIGVVTETDLMIRQSEALDMDEPKRRFPFAELTPRARRQAARSRAFTADQLMTARSWCRPGNAPGRRIPRTSRPVPAPLPRG